MRQESTLPPHVKGHIHNMIVQPAMLYGMETVPMTIPREETGSDINEDVQMGMRPHTIRDHVRNYDIRERQKVESIT